MKVNTQDECLKLAGCPKEIPDGLLNEEWAQKNHGQSLTRLNERGGISLSEALAIIWRKPWNEHDAAHAIVTMHHLITGYKIGKEVAREKVIEAVKLARKQMIDGYSNIEALSNKRINPL